MSEAGAVRAHDLSFRYAGGDRDALRAVTFEVAPGDCLLVVGPSGSGKSTLALAIAGLVGREIPGALRGRLEVGGLDPITAPRAAVAERVGIVFQDPDSQLVMDRVEDDVAFGLENRGWPRDAMRRRVPDVLREAGLLGLAARRPTTLSGGEQQRLALAGVLAPMPGVLVLDEPTANLDPGGRSMLFARLAALREARTATLVLVEHRVGRAWSLADHVLALGPDGVPIDVGPPDAVLARSREAMAGAGIWLPDDEPRSVAAERPVDPGRPAERVAPAGEPPVDRGHSDGAAAVGEPLVEATRLRFGYRPGVPVLDGVDLALEAGERVALLGANGSGKSTLGRLLVGLLRPDDGRVRLAGADPARLPAAELARRAGYVFQDPERQFLARTVRQEIELGLTDGERTHAPELMAALGLPLEAFGARSPYRLSGGEQRRLSLATMLVRRPSLLVLDEPTFGQDRRGYEGLLAILRDRVATGACVVAATHDERFVTDFASRALTLAAGRVTGDVALSDPGPAAG